MNMSRIMILVRWALGVLFLWTGALKLADPVAAVDALNHYRLLPAALLAPVALMIPWLELVGALALITRPLRGGGWMIALTLSAGFAFFTGSALWRGLDISCGCFGGQNGSGHLPWVAALDVVMLSVSALGLKHWLQSTGLRRPPSRP